MRLLRILACCCLLGWNAAWAGDPMQTLYLIQRLMPREGFFPWLVEDASLGQIADWGRDMNLLVKAVPHAIREVNKIATASGENERQTLQEYSIWISSTIIREVDAALQQTIRNWRKDVHQAVTGSTKKRDKATRQRLDQAWLALEQQVAFEQGYYGSPSEETLRLSDQLAEAEGRYAASRDKIYKKYPMPVMLAEEAAWNETARQALALSNQSDTLGQPVVTRGVEEREGVEYLATGAFQGLAWREMEARALEHAQDGEFVRVVVLRNFSQSLPGVPRGQWHIHQSWRLGPVDIPTAASVGEAREE